MKKIIIILFMLIGLSPLAFSDRITPTTGIDIGGRSILSNGTYVSTDSLYIQTFHGGANVYAGPWINPSDNPGICYEYNSNMFFYGTFADIDGAGGDGQYLVNVRLYNDANTEYMDYYYQYIIGTHDVNVASMDLNVIGSGQIAGDAIGESELAPSAAAEIGDTVHAQAEDYKADVSNIATSTNMQVIDDIADNILLEVAGLNGESFPSVIVPSDTTSAGGTISKLTADQVYSEFINGANENIFKSDSILTLLTNSMFDTLMNLMLVRPGSKVYSKYAQAADTNIYVLPNGDTALYVIWQHPTGIAGQRPDTTKTEDAP